MAASSVLIVGMEGLGVEIGMRGLMILSHKQLDLTAHYSKEHHTRRRKVSHDLRPGACAHTRSQHTSTVPVHFPMHFKLILKPSSFYVKRMLDSLERKPL